MQVQTLFEINGEKTTIAIKCCKPLENSFLRLYQWWAVEETKKKLAVDPGGWKVSVSRYNLKYMLSEIFSADLLRLLQSVRFFGILSPNFGYDPSWEELIALIILTSQFLCVDHSFQTFTRLRWISKNNNFYCSNRLLAHFFYERNNFEGTSIETKRCLHCRGKDYEEGMDEIMDTIFFEPFGKEVENAE